MYIPGTLPVNVNRICKVRAPLFCIVLHFLNLLSCWITSHWQWLRAPNLYIRCSNNTSQNVSQSNKNLFYFYSPWNFHISNLAHGFIWSDTIQEKKTKREVFACCCNLRGHLCYSTQMENLQGRVCAARSVKREPAAVGAQPHTHAQLHWNRPCLWVGVEKTKFHLPPYGSGGATEGDS